MSVARQVGLLGFFLVTAAVGAYLASFWSKKNHTPGPMIGYSRVLDLGECDLGEIVTGSFRVVNRGQTALELSQFRTSCSCAGVEAAWDGKSRRVEKAGIAPGGFVDLSVRVSVGAQPGAQQLVEIVFATNDPSEPIGKIDVMVQRVKGTVFVSPNSVVFGSVRSGRREVRVVDVFDNGVKERRVNTVKSLNPDRFEVRLIPISDSDKRKKHDFAGCLIARFEVIARTDRIGPLDGDVELVSSDEKRPKVLVPITGKVSSDVGYYPSVVVLPRCSGKGFVRFADILLVDREGRPFEAMLEAVPKGLTATIRPAVLAGQLTLRVECEKDYATFVYPDQTSVIRIRTTSKGGFVQHQNLVVHPGFDE